MNSLSKKSKEWTRRELNPRPFAITYRLMIRTKMRSEHHTPRPHALILTGQKLLISIFSAWKEVDIASNHTGFAISTPVTSGQGSFYDNSLAWDPIMTSSCCNLPRTIRPPSFDPRLDHWQLSFASLIKCPLIPDASHSVEGPFVLYNTPAGHLLLDPVLSRRPGVIHNPFGPIKRTMSQGMKMDVITIMKRKQGSQLGEHKS